MPPPSIQAILQDPFPDGCRVGNKSDFHGVPSISWVRTGGRGRKRVAGKGWEWTAMGGFQEVVGKERWRLSISRRSFMTPAAELWTPCVHTGISSQGRNMPVTHYELLSSLSNLPVQGLPFTVLIFGWMRVGFFSCFFSSQHGPALPANALARRRSPSWATAAFVLR